ncbi:MAG: hypothetical protein K8R59_00335, partial [Thermoanaerobaculales bacterium]|nr:hypothetical protein [Thermoanaerobaculales bacterium]
MRNGILGIIFLTILIPSVAATGEVNSEVLEALDDRHEALRHDIDQLNKGVNDLLWYHRVGDVAVIDKVRIYGPPRWKEEHPEGIGAGNPLKFYCYVFTPKGFDQHLKLPLLILPHGGVHADFTTYYAHIVRELVAQGYVVVAPEYRGSTGYG